MIIIYIVFFPDLERGTARSGERENKTNTAQASTSNAESSQKIPDKDTEQKESDSGVETNCSAFEQKNTESEQPESLNLPSTSGLQTRCKSTTVIKDSNEESNSVELSETKPSCSDISVSDKELDCTNTVSEKYVSNFIWSYFSISVIYIKTAYVI